MAWAVKNFGVSDFQIEVDARSALNLNGGVAILFSADRQWILPVRDQRWLVQLVAQQFLLLELDTAHQIGNILPPSTWVPGKSVEGGSCRIGHQGLYQRAFAWISQRWHLSEAPGQD